MANRDALIKTDQVGANLRAFRRELDRSKESFAWTIGATPYELDLYERSILEMPTQFVVATLERYNVSAARILL